MCVYVGDTKNIAGDNLLYTIKLRGMSTNLTLMNNFVAHSVGSHNI